MKLEDNAPQVQTILPSPQALQTRALDSGIRTAVVSRGPASEPSRPRRHLTEREKQILRLICEGMTNPAIATSLRVSRETVKSELKRIFRKIDVSNRTQAAVLLVKQGWL